jgi:hypothetical protein
VAIPLCAWLSYRLGKRKTTTPMLVAVIGGLLALVSIFALIYIAILSLKKDSVVAATDV